MPLTAATWCVGWLAIAGIAPLSGFFAKDQVIAAATGTGRVAFSVAALIGAFLTAIYVSRGTFLTFFSGRRHEGHPHESPWLMRIALIVLAVGAAVAGAVAVPPTTGILPRFLAPVVGEAHEHFAGPSELVLGVISVSIALLGILLAYVVYLSGKIDWVALRVRLAGPKRSLERGFYVDDLYGTALVGPGKLVSAFAAYVFDRRVIDGAINGIGRLFGALASRGRKVQTGLVRNYALAFLVGVVGILWYLEVRL